MIINIQPISLMIVWIVTLERTYAAETGLSKTRDWVHEGKERGRLPMLGVWLARGARLDMRIHIVLAVRGHSDLEGTAKYYSA